MRHSYTTVEFRVSVEHGRLTGVVGTMLPVRGVVGLRVREDPSNQTPTASEPAEPSDRHVVGLDAI